MGTFSTANFNFGDSPEVVDLPNQNKIQSKEKNLRILIKEDKLPLLSSNLIFKFGFPIIGLNLSIFILTIILMIISRLFKIDKSQENNLINILLKNFKWGIVIKIYNLSMFQFIFLLILEFRTVNFSQIGNNPSIYIALGCGFIFFLANCFFYYILNRKDFEDETVIKEYGALIEGVDPIFYFKRNYIIFNFLRKFLIIFSLVNLYEYPAIQIGSCLAISVIFFGYILFLSPFSNKTLKYSNIFSEIIIIGFIFIVLIFKNNLFLLILKLN